MGPTYLVLWRAKHGSMAVVLYDGDNEAEAKAVFDAKCAQDRSGMSERECTVYLTTVRAEARLS